MSSASERLEVIQQNYMNALQNEPHDLAAAKTPADVTAVQANVAVARTNFFAAVAAELSSSDGAVETAFVAAKAALKSVKDARAESEAIAKLLGKLGAATKAASDLLNAATKKT